MNSPNNPFSLDSIAAFAVKCLIVIVVLVVGHRILLWTSPCSNSTVTGQVENLYIEMMRVPVETILSFQYSYMTGHDLLSNSYSCGAVFTEYDTEDQESSEVDVTYNVYHSADTGYVLYVEPPNPF